MDNPFKALNNLRLLKGVLIFVAVGFAQGLSAHPSLKRCKLRLFFLVPRYAQQPVVEALAAKNSRIFTESDLQARVLAEAEHLRNKLSLFDRHVIFSPRIEFHVTEADDPMGAFANVLNRSIHIPLQLIGEEDPVFARAVIGHEAGHLIFSESMRELLADIARHKPKSKLLESLSSMVGDRATVKREVEILEAKWPSLASRGMYADLSHVDANDFFYHRLMTAYLEMDAKAEKPVDTNSEHFFEIFAHYHLAAHSEVFSDIVGSAVAGSPDWARGFSNPVEQKIRDFTFFDKNILALAEKHPQALKSALDQIMGGAPHLLHLFERARIYELFYRSKNRTFGVDADYDAKVMASYMESLAASSVQVWERVLVPRGPDSGLDGASALAAALKYTHGDVEDQIHAEMFRILKQKAESLNSVEDQYRLVDLKANQENASAAGDEVVEVEYVAPKKNTVQVQRSSQQNRSHNQY
jgi:hypothetical protein